MVEKVETSHWWWFDSHKNSKRSPWLQSTLGDLDKKTKAMLKLIEEDADSFAQRAEMYYKKRPELISMVEDFYRAYRSLAERYDQGKLDSGTRLLTTLGSPFSSPAKYLKEKRTDLIYQTSDGYSESCETEEDAESEVEDPEQFEETEIIAEERLVQQLMFEEDITQSDEVLPDKETRDEVSSEVSEDEVVKLREQIEKLKEESKSQRAQLMQKDEEKREVIRQLSLSIQVLKEENMEMRRLISRESSQKWNPFEICKLMKGGFLGKLFNGAPKSSATIVAL